MDWIKRIALAALIGTTLNWEGCPPQAAEGETATPDIIRVEEDWEIVVSDPDWRVDSPQIVTVFGPDHPDSGVHAVFELNHGTQPDFAEGGMQLQVWGANSLLGYRRQHAPAELNTENETITYTTATEIESNGVVLMEVINGVSASWGEFGGTRTLRMRVYTDRTKLNDSFADQSVANSRVAFGSNRVALYKRTAARYYTADGLHSTDNTDQIVEQWAQ